MTDEKTIIGESLIGKKQCSVDDGRKSFILFIVYIILSVFSGVFLPMIISPLIYGSCMFTGDWYSYYNCLNAISGAYWISWMAGILSFVFGILALWELLGKCTLPAIVNKVSSKKTEGK